MWVEKFNQKRQRKFWYHTGTKETTWVDPNAEARLAEGTFVEKFDAKHQRPFWVNIDTKESTWVRPPADRIKPASEAKKKPVAEEAASLFPLVAAVESAPSAPFGVKIIVPVASEEASAPGRSEQTPSTSSSSDAPVSLSKYESRRDALANFGQIGSYNTEREKSYSRARLVDKQKLLGLRSSTEDVIRQEEPSVSSAHYFASSADKGSPSEPESPLEAPARGPVGANRGHPIGGAPATDETEPPLKKRNVYSQLLRIKKPVILTSRPAFSTLHQRRMAGGTTPGLRLYEAMMDMDNEQSPMDKVDERVVVEVGQPVILSPSVGGSGKIVLLDEQGEGAQVELGTGARVWVPCVDTAMAPAGSNLVGHRVRVDNMLGFVQAYDESCYLVQLEDGSVVSKSNVVSVPGAGELVRTPYGRGVVLSVSESDSVVVHIPGLGVMPFETKSVLLSNFVVGDCVKVSGIPGGGIGTVTGQDDEGLVVSLDDGGEIHVADANDIELWSRSRPLREEDWVMVSGEDVTLAAAAAAAAPKSDQPLPQVQALNPSTEEQLQPEVQAPSDAHTGSSETGSEEDDSDAVEEEEPGASTSSASMEEEEEEEEEREGGMGGEAHGEAVATAVATTAAVVNPFEDEEHAEQQEDAALLVDAFGDGESSRESDLSELSKTNVDDNQGLFGEDSEEQHHVEDPFDQVQESERREAQAQEPESHSDEADGPFAREEHGTTGPFDEVIDASHQAQVPANDPFDDVQEEEQDRPRSEKDVSEESLGVVVVEEEEANHALTASHDPFDDLDEEPEEQDYAAMHEDAAQEQPEEPEQQQQQHLAAPIPAPMSHDPFDEVYDEDADAEVPLPTAKVVASNSGSSVVALLVTSRSQSEPPEPSEVPKSVSLQARLDALKNTSSRALADLKQVRQSSSTLSRSSTEPAQPAMYRSQSDRPLPSAPLASTPSASTGSVRGLISKLNHLPLTGGAGPPPPPRVPQTRPLSFRKDSSGSGGLVMENTAALSKPTIASGRRRQPTRAESNRNTTMQLQDPS